MVQKKMPSRDYKSINLYAPKSDGGNGDNNSNNGRHRVSNGMYRVHKILSAEEIASGKQTRWAELEIRGTVRNISPELWKLQHLTALFLCNNNLQRLPSQISLLTNLQLLDLSNNKLRSLPAELGDMISLQSLYLNNNQIRILPYEMGKLFRLLTLGLNGNPLTPEIAQIYREQSGTQKLLQFLLDHLTISVPPPPDRQWLISRTPDRDTASFSIMSYNILCDKYATSNLYAYCPSWALTWDYRKKYILSEITRHDADIVTLQEVETEQFHKFFKMELAPRGYNGTFSPKSRAKTMAEDERKYVDGCAIFWKADKFELDREHVIEFTRLAIAKADGNEQMLNRVMTRDNIALVAVFRVKENIYANSSIPSSPHLNVINSPLIVCTAHIHWDPEFCDVKLVQSMMLMQELGSVVDRTAEQWRIPPKHVPLIVCGDLNSLPESGVYEYLTAGKISSDHEDFKEFKGQSCLQKLCSSPYTHDNTYSHKLQLKSAYEIKTLPFTNYTYDFKGVIDYIFGSPSLIRMSVLGPMDFIWFQENKIVGCPFPGIPSDHIPLMVHYAIMPSSLSRFTQHQ